MTVKMYKLVQNMMLFCITGVMIIMFCMITFLDMNPYVVMSGSMEPALPVGSICLVDCQAIYPDAGEIISYKAGDSIVTHRVKAVTKDGYVTKGDANDCMDPAAVKQKQVIGTCKGNIPYLGYVVMFLRTAKGIAITVIGIILWCLLGKLIENRRE